MSHVASLIGTTLEFKECVEKIVVAAENSTLFQVFAADLISTVFSLSECIQVNIYTKSSLSSPPFVSVTGSSGSTSANY